MKYAVYHADPYDPTNQFAPAPKEVSLDAFKRVAVVDGPDDHEEGLDEAWEKTNNIDHDWQENPEVIWHAGYPQRSSAVGDLVITGDGRAYIVAPIGFKRVHITDAAKHWMKIWDFEFVS